MKKSWFQIFIEVCCNAIVEIAVVIATSVVEIAMFVVANAVVEILLLLSNTFPNYLTLNKQQQQPVNEKA